jgi:predicted NAD/FAD-binding protein
MLLKNIPPVFLEYLPGAWLRYGFHEDGILSSKSVINKLLKDDEKNKELLRIL